LKVSHWELTLELKLEANTLELKLEANTREIMVEYKTPTQAHTYTHFPTHMQAHTCPLYSEL